MIGSSCKYCGKYVAPWEENEYMCYTWEEVQKCSQKKIAENKMASYQKRKKEVEDEYKNVQTLMETLKGRVNKGHGRGSLTRKELEMIKRNLKGAHQYFTLYL